MKMKKKQKNILLNYFWPGSYRKRTNLGEKNPTTNNNILWSRSLVEQNASFFLKKKKISWKKCVFFLNWFHIWNHLQIYIYKCKSTQFPRWTDIKFFFFTNSTKSLVGFTHEQNVFSWKNRFSWHSFFNTCFLFTWKNSNKRKLFCSFFLFNTSIVT